MASISFIGCHLHKNVLRMLALQAQLRSMQIEGCISEYSSVVPVIAGGMREGGFQSLQHLSVFLTDEEVHLPALSELKQLQGLRLSGIVPTGISEFLPLVPLKSLHLTRILLPKGSRLISPTLQKIYIDELTTDLHQAMSPTDLPALTSLEFEGISFTHGDVTNMEQLRCKLARLAALPLQALQPKDECFMLKGAFHAHDLSVSLLQLLSASPLPDVLNRVKAVNVDLSIGAGCMLALSALFHGIERVRCSRSFSDSEGLVDAVLGMRSLTHLIVTLATRDPCPSVISALLAAHRSGTPFHLAIYTEKHATYQQLQAIRKDWGVLARKLLGGPGNVSLSVPFEL